MDWDAVSAMAEVIGVLVVIASLIYIGHSNKTKLGTVETKQ